ncbi:MAG: GNAT family N-acetyltransferase [Bacteroidia bacterium]
MKNINQYFFENFPELKTKRLYLRSLLPEDAKDVFRMRSNARVNQFIGRENMVSEKSAEEIIERTLQAYQNQQAIAWAAYHPEFNKIIGTCGLMQIEKVNRRAEIGGEMWVDYWGKNLAIEAVTAIVAFGFKELNLHSIEAKVSPQNRGAIAILSHLRFVQEAYLKDRFYHQNSFHDLAIYSAFNPNES